MATHELTKAHHLALQGACSSLRGLFAGADRDEVLTRHQIGELLLAVTRAEDKYGQRAVERIAEEIGETPRTLYRHIAVAEAWSRADLHKRLDKTNRLGRPLSWTHLVALAGVKDGVERETLLEVTLDRAWSTRELEVHLLARRERHLAPTASDPAGKVDVVHETLKEGIATWARTGSGVRVFVSALEDRLEGVDLSEHIDARLLRRALAACEQLQSEVQTAVQRLKVAAESHRRLRVETPASAEASTEDALAADDEENDDASERSKRRSRSKR